MTAIDVRAECTEFLLRSLAHSLVPKLGSCGLAFGAMLGSQFGVVSQCATISMRISPIVDSRFGAS